MVEKQHVDKRLVASSFEASASTYEASAIVQKEISGQLVRILERHGIVDYRRAFEIGCATGVLTRLICALGSIETLYVNDIVKEFCSTTRKRVMENTGYVEMLPGDIEGIQLPTQLDLVISSSTFQWMSDLPGLFGKIHNSLKPNGHLAFTIFGPGTMAEIAEITGRSLQYHSNDALAAMLDGNYRITSMHTEKKCLYFPTVRAVLRHIQQTGVGGLGRAKWTKAKLIEFERQYAELFLSDLGVPVSYVSTFILAEKL